MKNFCAHSLRNLSLLLFLSVFAGCALQGAYIQEGRQNYVPIPDPAEIDYSVFLIGDAGAPNAAYQEPVLKALQDEASEVTNKRSIILFLGDNIYEYGMSDTASSDRKDSERRINEQIAVAESSRTRAVFLPGNHDWKQGRSDGLKSLSNQESFIWSKKSEFITELPSKGCPGPEVLNLGDRLRLILIDSQWILQDKESRDGSNCSCSNEDALFSALDNAIKDAGSRSVLIAVHHPLDSHGNHGGFFPWQDHIFPLRALNKSLWIPLPVIGSLYPLARILGISSQDMSSGEYKKMVHRFDEVIGKYKTSIFTGGHEHNLQVLQHNNSLVLVSGAGSETKITPVSKDNNTFFAESHTGFMRIDYLKNGRIRVGVIIPADKAGSREEIFSMWAE